MNFIRHLRLLFILMVLGSLSASGRAVAGQDDSVSSKGDEELFEIRKYDEVYFKSGDVVRGTLFETDVKGEFKIKDYKRNTTRNFLESETTKILHAQSPDSAMKRLSGECVGNPAMALKIARQAMSRFNNMIDKVIALLERESGSRDPELLAFLCEIYLQNGKNAEALKTAETLVSASTGKGKPFLLRGLAQLALRNNEAAEKDFDQAEKLSPDDSEILVARANLLLSTGRASKAQTVFSDTLKKNPKNVAALVGRGLVLLRQGESLEAEQSFQDALAISSEHHQAKVGLAFSKIMNKHADDAYVLGERLLSSNPKDADAYAIKAFSKFYAGDKASLDAFDKELKESFKERPNQPRLLWAWAASLDRRAKIEEASGAKDSAATAKAMRELSLQKMGELEQLNPSDAAIQYLLAERKFRSGDYAGAQKGFQRTVALSPAYAPAHAALAATALKSSNWQAAFDAYTKAAVLDKKGEYLAGKGLALLKLQKFEEAEDLFRKTLDLDSKNVTARCGLGYMKNSTKNKSAAVDFFQQALAVDGNCAYAADALSKIYRQDDLALEYVTFEDEAQTANWKSRNAGSLRSQAGGGKLLFSGTQGSSSSTKIEFCKDIRADEFSRVEADFELQPSSPVTFGLRIAGSGSSNFELEMGKDESNEIKVRYRDYAVPTPLWSSLKLDWPVEGRVRLGLDTEDLKNGKIRLWVNGKQAAEVKLVLQKPSRITVGIFLQSPAKETVVASVDNIVLVTRLAPGSTVENNDGLTLTGSDKDKKIDEKKPDIKKTDVKKPADSNPDF